MIKVLNARLAGDCKIDIDFSDHTQGLFDASAYLATRSGPLLDALREPAYVQRFFIDAGALCWPNGLEISPARLHELCALSHLSRWQPNVAISDTAGGHAKPAGL